MSVVVSLRDVISELDVISDEHHAYLNIHTGELVRIGDEEIRAIEDDYSLQGYPEWRLDIIEKTREVLGSEDYLPLPSRFDIHEYAIMERFCYSVDDEELKRDLISQIRGSGAFRRFKGAIHRHNIVADWYCFRERILEEIAIDWLEAHGIAYTKDDDADQRRGA